jgi:hypothetical protein
VLRKDYTVQRHSMAKIQPLEEGSRLTSGRGGKGASFAARS